STIGAPSPTKTAVIEHVEMTMRWKRSSGVPTA
ncbi:MAG: hypothetical protein RL072_924, partial [Actinomycetota bacterium]